MIDLTPTTNEKLSKAINERIDKALEKENAKQTPRTYLGGSRLGVECERALYFEYSQTPKDPDKGFKGKTLRRFIMGHWAEDETARWMKMAGFDLKTHDKDGEQFGFSTANDKIAGHIDGVLTSGPKALSGVCLEYPILWEHKVMKASKYRECNRNGVRKANPTYFAQLMVYMAYMELRNAMFMYLNTDTSEIAVELIPLDLSEAQKYSDKGVRIIEAENCEDLPRVSRSNTFFQCKFCDWADRCWD